MKRILLLWSVIGAFYLVLEGIWRGGWVHIVMFPIGGLCGVAVGGINQIPKYYNSCIITQSLIGAAIVSCVEFIAGCVFNLWLGWGLWDYSTLPANVMGQICLPYSALWFAIMPFAIWLEDTLRYRLWGDGEYYTIKSIYAELVTFH